MIQSVDPNNLVLLEQIFEKDPEQFKSFLEENGPEQFKAHDIPQKQSVSLQCSEIRIRDLIDAYRRYGYIAAEVNPIALKPVSMPQQLDLEYLGFKKSELSQDFPTLGLLNKPKAALEEIIQRLRTIYCGKIGFEFMNISNEELKKWIEQKVESNRPHLSVDQKKMVLQQLNRSELFESFLHTKYTGQKRFSLEGAETLIPMLEAIVETGNRLGLQEFVIGMAHRGRLNVLSNILNKSYSEIFSEFEEHYIPNSFEGSGDVKYHKGFYSEVKIPEGKTVKIVLAPNPSHLESVDPVVEGQVKAKQMMMDDKNQEKVVPILIHGDAALSGQGVVYETLEFCKLEGYSTGGTLHLVINNQIGFTAVPQESRSTCYCTAIATSFDLPVFHVNAEDPEEAVFVTNLAVEIRQKFHCDVFIDLQGYRKYGHNESDEPAYTQPLEYQLIRKKKPIRELYRDQLIQQGVVERNIAENLEKEFTQALHEALQQSKRLSSQKTQEQKKLDNPFIEIDTSVSETVLKTVAERISTIPDEFNIHPKLKNIVQERRLMIDSDKPIDWGMAELLAYGSILWKGSSVRISGQDSRRGTFSHRHAVWMDQAVEKAYFPLNHLKEDQGQFDVVNSPLSEYAVLGFEFGYSCVNKEALVIWEAQFGDFGNGAQIVIDQYISTAEQKWGQTFGLTLFLPHGYEGQGPEHSSGRMERFLTLCGNDNMRIVNPTTPAQFFHLLRRQVLNPERKPLIVFTPKGLLRHPACVSSRKDLEKGSFQWVMDDPKPGINVEKIIFCSGRIYYDLAAAREKAKADTLAIIRLEQLYPLNVEMIQQILQKYSDGKECIWVQEEPQNMGAWTFIQPLLQDLLPKGIELQYVGRKRSASPATGSHALHKQQHDEIFASLNLK